MTIIAVVVAEMSNHGEKERSDVSANRACRIRKDALIPGARK